MFISLNATRFERNLQIMFGQLSVGQQHWFVHTFPRYIDSWMENDFWGRQKSKHPRLKESYSVVQKKKKPREVKSLDKFIFALWCVRKCYGPIQPKALYRLTQHRNPKGLRNAVFRSKSQLKPLTSWSTDSQISVINRANENNDYLLTYKNPAAKHILSSTAVLQKMAKVVMARPEKFGLGVPVHNTTKYIQEARKAKAHWQSALTSLNKFVKVENEYMVYLSQNESFKVKLTKIVAIERRL
jgi:hypothetical protein